MSTPDRGKVHQREELPVGSADGTGLENASGARFGRRRFIKGAGLSAAAAMGLAAPAVWAQGGARSWHMVTTWPIGQEVLNEGAGRFAARVTEMTQGQLTVEVSAGGERVAIEDVFEAVATGKVQAASSVSFYWAERIPAAQWFASIPFGLNAQGMNAWLYNGGGLKLWEEVYAPHGVVPRPLGNTGVQMGGWFSKRLRHIDDFRGLKMRIPGLGGRIVADAGGDVVTVPGDRIVEAFQSGQIEAAEWIGPLDDMALGLHEVASYYYYPGWQEPGSCIELIINKSAYDELPAHMRAIIDVAAAETNIWTLGEYESRNFVALETLVRDHRVKLARFPKSALEGFRYFSGQVLAAEADRDAESKRVHEAYRSFADHKLNWDQVSERPYYDLVAARQERLRRWLLPPDPY